MLSKIKFLIDTLKEIISKVYLIVMKIQIFFLVKFFQLVQWLKVLKY